MRVWILPTLCLVLIAGLGYLASVQAGEIERLTGLIEGSGPSSGQQSEAGPAGESRGMAARIEHLESEVSSLRSRLNRAELALRSPDDGAWGTEGLHGERRTGSGSGPGEDENRLEYTILELLDSEKGGVRERLRSVIREEREALREERRKEREQRWLERTEGVLDQLADEAGLSEAVRQGILALLQDEWDEIREVFRAARAEGSFDEPREKALGVRRATDVRVRQMVDDEQYEAYREMRESELTRPFGRVSGRPGRERAGPRQ